MDGSAPSPSFHQWRQSPLKLHQTRALNLDLIQAVIRPRDVFHLLDWETQVLPTDARCDGHNFHTGARRPDHVMLAVLYSLWPPSLDLLCFLQTPWCVPSWIPGSPPSLLPSHPYPAVCAGCCSPAVPALLLLLLCMWVHHCQRAAAAGLHAPTLHALVWVVFLLMLLIPKSCIGQKQDS